MPRSEFSGEEIQSTLSSTDLRMLTVREAAGLIGVGETKFREKINSGEINTMRWGNENRIPLWEIRRWQESEVKAKKQSQKVFSLLETIKGKERYKGRKK